MKWRESVSVHVPPELLAAANGRMLLAQALLRRGIATPEAVRAFLDPSLYPSTSPFELPDMELVAERLRTAIARGERILVWGDFDADGLTATALLVEALQLLGAVTDWYIPDRRSESHGLHWRPLQVFLGRGTRVLLTCDTGMASHEVVRLASAAGLDVLLTDHHELPAVLPAALGVINPKRLSAGHPLRALSGVGVAYKLAEALGVPGTGLDLVALGMIADMAMQVGEVRPLLQLGLVELRRTKRVGMQALLEVAEVDPAGLDEGDVGFALAPRLNALGRLANAALGVELFLTADLTRARAIAAEMEALNVRRQFLSRQVFLAGQALLDRDRSLLSDPVLVLSHPEWPSGVLGIAASRLAERYARPVVLIAAPPTEIARGSARSVPGVDIYAALAEVKDLFVTFGGHPMAAGFSIAPEHIPELRRRLLQSLARQVGSVPPEPELTIEGRYCLGELDAELFEETRQLAPFGPGNPPLVLVTEGLRVATVKSVGRTGEHRVVVVEDEDGRTATAVWWQSTDLPLPEGSFDLAYVLREGHVCGERMLQLEWLDAQGSVPAVLQTVLSPRAEIADYRGVADPLLVLGGLWQPEGMQVWAEALAVPGYTARDREGLVPTPALVVWTCPPAGQVWRETLARARPEQVYLFAVDPQVDEPEPFLRRLAGLVKHALTAYKGRIEWRALAAAMAHRVETVQAGLRWLVASGRVSLEGWDDTAVTVARGGRRDQQEERAAREELQALLRETAVYRAYFRTADARTLVNWGESATAT